MTDLIAEAQALDAKARHHKREANRHRKAAKVAREQLAEVERQCAALGIAFKLNPGAGHHPWPKTQSSTSTR